MAACDLAHWPEDLEIARAELRGPCDDASTVWIGWSRRRTEFFDLWEAKFLSGQTPFISRVQPLIVREYSRQREPGVGRQARLPVSDKQTSRYLL